MREPDRSSKRLKFAVVLLLSMCSVTHAQSPVPPEHSIQLMYERCKGEMAGERGHYCLGYVEGVAQVMIIIGALGRDEFSMCPRPPVGLPSGAAMIQAFMNWAEKHLEHWSEMEVVGVSLALSSSWPCGK